MTRIHRSALYHKYAHVGCPAARMEDNCAKPDECADYGRCIDLDREQICGRRLLDAND